MAEFLEENVHVTGLRVEPAPNSECAPISVLAVPGNARLWYTDM